MKRCLLCHTPHDASDWRCPSCGQVPAQLGGYPAFAPELAEQSAGFRPELFAELAALEAKNFWFRARNHLLQWTLRRYFPQSAHFLEIGCGTGFVLAGMKSAFPGLRLAGSEIYSVGLQCAAERLRDAELFQMDARHIPFQEAFDVVGAFDVLEHIEEDEDVLAQMYQAARPGGGILITVPQHDWLWSAYDVMACHVRRYNRRDLVAKVERAGFTVVRVTSFVSVLLPLMMLSRRRKPKPDADELAELRIGSVLNAALEKTLDIERGLIQAGVSFPAGGSLLLAARKERR
jgi:SAM-dependent methyltransferase